jgi:hypothetical protein
VGFLNLLLGCDDLREGLAIVRGGGHRGGGFLMAGCSPGLRRTSRGRRLPSALLVLVFLKNIGGGEEFLERFLVQEWIPADCGRIRHGVGAKHRN